MTMNDSFYTDSQKRIEVLESIGLSSATAQFVGYLKFLESVPDVKSLLENLLADKAVETALEKSSHQVPPNLKSLEEIASASVIMLDLIRRKGEANVLFNLGIRGHSGSEFASIPYEFTRRYVRPLHAFLILSFNSLNVLQEFQCRFTTLLSPQFQEASFRVAGFWEWLNANPVTAEMIRRVLASSNAQQILAASSYHVPPQTESPDDILAVGLLLMQECASGEDIYKMHYSHGIRPDFPSTNLQDTTDAVMAKFIIPALAHIEEQLVAYVAPSQEVTVPEPEVIQQRIPPEIQESLAAFKSDHPETTAFIMMQFAQTETHSKIVATIKAALADKGITALRADDHQYHDDVFPNVKTYMHGCDFGVAVFERIEDEVFNPNVSLEVGYLLALGKPICYLKDKSLKRLPTDLISKLYREFDTRAIESTLPAPLLKWLEEKRIGKSSVGTV